MNSPTPIKLSVHRSRTFALFGLLCIQSFCAVFLVADVVTDFLDVENLLGDNAHRYIELAVVVTLVLGITFTAREIRKVLQRNQSVEATLRGASGAFYQLIEDRFDAWSLTQSERDVARFAIKGFSIAEIAALRQTKEGTIKAQCNATYRKAGVSGRLQLLSLFIEELMGNGLITSQDARFVPSQALSTHGSRYIADTPSPKSQQKPCA